MAIRFNNTHPSKFWSYYKSSLIPLRLVVELPANISHAIAESIWNFYEAFYSFFGCYRPIGYGSVPPHQTSITLIVGKTYEHSVSQESQLDKD